MTRTRLLGAIGLVGLLGALAGCGGDPKPAPAPPGLVGPKPPDPKSQQDLYELDPAKHVIPAAPATGRLGGKTFTPDKVELEGNKLTFRQGKDFFADLEILIFLDKPPTEGQKITVRSDQKWTDGIPSLHVAARKGDDLPKTEFVNERYALTLEVGKVEKGKSQGKIYLCLPGPDRSYLAGTFVAASKRGLSEPPGADDVPYIQGSVSPQLKKGQSIWVGYVGTAGGKVISDGAGTTTFEDGSGAARSGSFAPRAAGVRFDKFTPHFDFTSLPPGRYLVYARVKDIGAAWAWADVTVDSKVTTDLKFDEKNVGAVEVNLPANERNAQLVPADLGTPAPNESFVGQLAFSLDLRAEAKDGKATILGVPVGKYQVRAGNLRADIEVTAGKTATVELKPAKK